MNREEISFHESFLGSKHLINPIYKMTKINTKKVLYFDFL
jgi:hypothetical protein